MVKGEVSKGKELLDLQSEENSQLHIEKEDSFTCGSRLKTAGRLYSAAAEFVRFFCLICNKAFKTPNQHNKHNESQHPGEKVCEICLQPTKTPDEHEFQYCQAAMLRLKNEGRLIEDDGPGAAKE